MLLVVLVGLLAASAGIGARATYGARLTADEPQYLLSTLSVLEDGNLDIGDELTARRWRAFHAAELPVQTTPLADGRQVSPHDPLLPLLLAPGVAAATWLVGGDAGPWLGAKATLAVVAALLAGLTWWTAVHRFDVDSTAATLGAGVFAASMPLATYGNQIYPELPAALLVVSAVALITGSAAVSRIRRRLHVVATCVVLVALPWLAVKYAPVAASLGGVTLVMWWRQGRRGAIIGALITAFAAAVSWVVIHEQVWTGLTAYASADLFAQRGEFSAVGFAPNLLGRSRRLVGLLIGRDFGLAAWQPAWLMVVPALTALVIKRPFHWLALGVPLAVGWLVATFVALTMQGWWSPGRQVVVVAPLGVIVICWWVGRVPWRRWALGLLGLTGIAAWLRLAWETSTSRLTLIVDFMDSSDPLLTSWRAILPAYLRMDARQWWLHGAWLAIGALTVWVVVVRERATLRPSEQDGRR